MHKNVHAYIFHGEEQYMEKNSIWRRTVYGEEQYAADCANIPVVTQGKTMDETIANLQEAVSLYFEDEEFSELGFQLNIEYISEIERSPYFMKDSV